MHGRSIAGAAAVAALMCAPQAAGQAPVTPPDAVKPLRVAAAAINVRDLEAAKAWYTSRLGLKVLVAIPATGPAHEYILSFGGSGAAVVLTQADNRPAGANAFGRLVLEVPDGEAFADWLRSQGVQSRVAVPRVAYLIADPEGNLIELYTPPKR